MESYGRVWLSKGGFWDHQTSRFEIPLILRAQIFPHRLHWNSWRGAKDGTATESPATGKFWGQKILQN